jgi:sterol desaturase/sphingolipid hydroxylase (fatty acid hydroxylase superfamily)
MILVYVLAGLSCWTLLEYGLHRFAFHERWLGWALAREHTEHHKRVSWFAPWSSKLLLALLIAGPLGLLLGAPFLAGLLGGWLGYEVLHRRIHVAAPLGAYGRWARRHHLAHHFADPRKNHGVTTPLWDWVFGTLGPSREVAVPARHLARLPWLMGPDGGVHPRFSETYRVR